MSRKVLLFGRTGKLGTALARAFDGWQVTGLGSRDLDVRDFAAVDRTVAAAEPEIIVNAAAFLGVDPCEKEPAAAARVNTLFPRRLARLAMARGAMLVHFSTETVFSGAKGDFYGEDDEPDPINVYGFTKFASELAIRDATPHYYVFRLPVLFGPSPRRNQLVERMIDKVRAGETTLRLADDIVTSPTYSLDAAETVRRIIEKQRPFGLYHLANTGRASLFDLMTEAIRLLRLPARVERASWRDFPSLAAKNTVTPLRQDRLPPMRPWQEALAAFCAAETGN
jgi:dTDP-4-dehydrorhamnose reductase